MRRRRGLFCKGGDEEEKFEKSFKAGRGKMKRRRSLLTVQLAKR